MCVLTIEITIPVNLPEELLCQELAKEEFFFFFLSEDLSSTCFLPFDHSTDSDKKSGLQSLRSRWPAVYPRFVLQDISIFLYKIVFLRLGVIDAFPSVLVQCTCDIIRVPLE